MALDTGLVMRVVGGRMNDLDVLRAELAQVLGAEPSMRLRLEIRLGIEATTITVTDDEVIVTDDTLRKVVAQADHAVARAAIKGFATEPDPTP